MTDREGHDLVVVQTFTGRPAADVAKSALDAAGIEAMVVGDDAGGVYPALWEGRGVGVAVNVRDVGAAREILSRSAHPPR